MGMVLWPSSNPNPSPSPSPSQSPSPSPSPSPGPSPNSKPSPSPNPPNPDQVLWPAQLARSGRAPAALLGSCLALFPCGLVLQVRLASIVSIVSISSIAIANSQGAPGEGSHFPKRGHRLYTATCEARTCRSLFNTPCRCAPLAPRHAVPCSLRSPCTARYGSPANPNPKPSPSPNPNPSPIPSPIPNPNPNPNPNPCHSSSTSTTRPCCG